MPVEALFFLSAVNFPAEKISAALASSQIVVSNNRGKNDTITVNSLQVGDVIIVYDQASRLIGTSQPVKKGTSSATVTIKQLGTKQGSILVSVKSTGKLESSKISMSFSGEISSTPPSLNQIAATVSLKITSLKSGDIVKVYNQDGKLIVTSQPVANGQSSLTVSIPKQVSKQETVYITVTSKGADESSKVAVNI